MSENVELRARFTGDANPFKAAAKQVTTVLDAFGRPMANLKRESEEAARSASRAFSQLKSRIDPAYKAAQEMSRASRVLNQQLTAGNIDLQEHGRLLTLAQQKYLAAAGAVDTMNSQVRASRFAAGNLMAQFQDIGVMVASGQSPFLMAVQQGSQINQVLLGLKDQGKSTMATLGAAARQFINPMQLVTFAVIAGVAAFGQWAMSAIAARREAAGAATGLASYVDIATEAREEIGNLADEQERLNRGLRDTTELGLERGIEEQLVVVQALQEQYELAQQTQAEGADVQLALLQAAEQELARRRELYETLVQAREEAERREEEEEQINERLEDQAEALRRIREARAEISLQLQDDLRSMREQIAMQELIQQYGEESAQVAEARARAEARSQGYVGQAVEQYVALAMQLRETEQETQDLQTAMEAINGISTANVQEQILAIARALNISTLAAERLRKALPAGQSPYIPEPQGAPMSGQPGLLAAQGAFAVPIGDPNAGTGGGGGGGSDPFEAEWERLRESFQTQAEIQMEAYAQQQEILQEALDRRLITLEEYHQMAEDLQQQHQDRMSAIDVYRYGTGLEKTQQFFGDMADAFATGNERMMQIGRAFGAAEALINAWRTFSQVMSDASLPWYAKLPAAISLLGSAMKAVQAIKSIGNDGSGPRSAGAVSGAGGGVGRPQEQAPAQQRSLTLIGDRFNRQQAIAIAEFMNDGTDDGLIIRGRR